MSGSVRRSRPSRAVAVLALALAALVAVPAAAQAHGGLSSPPTRTYVCRFLEPHAPQCEKAWAANPQAMYDWMEVNLSNADGRHQALIPDGHLCGAGREKYGAFDAATDAWPSTPVTAGPTEMVYTATAPHATSYYRLYLTKPGFDASSSPLGWSDLELLYDSGPLPAASENRFPVTLPARTGHQILYLVWQRSDSQEAFYGCSDVVFPAAAGGGGTTTPVITNPTTTDPEAVGHPHDPDGTDAGGGTTPAPSTPSPAKPAPARKTVERHGHLTFTTTVTSDWGAGYCATVQVKNRARRAVTWRASLKVPGTVTQLWSARGKRQGKKLTVRGRAYNARLRAGRTTSFGYCVKLTKARVAGRASVTRDLRVATGLTAVCRLD